MLPQSYLAVSLTNLGRIHQTNQNLSELQQALDCHRSAFHIRQKSVSNDHPVLALVYFNQKEDEQANVEVQKALNIQKKSFAANHCDIEQMLQLEKSGLNIRRNKKNQIVSRSV